MSFLGILDRTIDCILDFPAIVGRALTPEHKKRGTTASAMHDRQMRIGWDIEPETYRDLPSFNPTPSAHSHKDYYEEEARGQEYQEFLILKDLFASDKWPQAVNPELICEQNPQDRKERARGIMDFTFVADELRGKRFLDFGCGHGETLGIAMSMGAKSAFGYDPCIPTLPHCNTSPDTSPYVRRTIQGYYDVILMYDVLDHTRYMGMQEAMSLVSKHLAPNGKVYMRCHPWTARHGTHMYKKMNRAWPQLVFSKEELKRLEIEDEFGTHRTLLPAAQEYSRIFESTGLSVLTQTITSSPIEGFFLFEPVVNKRFISHWPSKSQGHLVAGIDFIDYVLQHGQPKEIRSGSEPLTSEFGQNI